MAPHHSRYFVLQGGSTLAIQLEKYRHSPGGRTNSLPDKLRQIVGASLEAYRDRPDTRMRRRKILLDYVNTVPLAAAPGYGAVHGLAQGVNIGGSMIQIEIPDFGPLNISNIVCDYNGTLAVDGRLLPGVSERINSLADVEVHVIMADTFGLAQEQLSDTNCRLTISPVEDQATWKRDYVRSLNANTSACIGNGRNNRLMLKEAALGIAVLEGEGASVETMMNAHILCQSFIDALDYFTKPRRLIATLRS